MLLTNRRLSLIFFCLAGMEVAWFTPFWLLLYRPAQTAPWLTYGVALTVLLAWTLTLELLSRTTLEPPRYQLAALGLMVLTSLLVVRVALYWGRPITDVHWLGQALSSSFRNRQGFPPALALVAGNLFLWQRATRATSRELTFFNVGVSFRLGILLLLLGGGLYTALRDQDLTPLLWIYMTLGLTAVAITRIHEKANNAQSAGRPLTSQRLWQLLLAVGVTVGGTAWLSVWYTSNNIWGLLVKMSPLWRVLKFVALGLLRVLVWLLEPVMEWLLEQMRRLIQFNWTELQPQSPLIPPGKGQEVLSRELQGPVWDFLRQAGIALVIIVLAVLVIGVLLLYLDKTRRQPVREETEEAEAEPITLGESILGRGLQALRDVAGLVRRFGISGQLLAAVSIQNIYANLCRLAQRRGHPRRPSQPPDDYLPILAQAFPGQEEALGRITEAYMRVHYGEHPVTLAELAQLRADYQQVRKQGSVGRPLSGGSARSPDRSHGNQ